MIFYRLIKPLWAKEKLPNKKPNPEFKEIIHGPSTIEGINFTKDFLEEKNKAGYNLYYFPNRPSTDVYTKEKFALSGKDIDVFSYIFLDMDLKEKVYESKEAFLKVLKDFNFTPSLTVDSGNGIHAYWKISDLTIEVYLKLQLCLIKKFDTDKSVFSALQLMRVPESLNTKKYKDYARSSIVKDLSNKKVYTLADIPEELDKILGPIELAKVQEHLDKLSGKYEVSLIDVDVNLLPERFVKLMDKRAKLKEMFTDPRSVGKDRSAVDLMLTSELYRLKFDINDALIIISNTQKALEKGASRIAYASLTVAKVYKNRATHRVTSVKDYMRNKKSDILEPKVNGPFYMDSDVLGSPWRKKEILGLIAGSGVGKTAVALNIVKDIIENNPHNDEVYIFFSLEMSKDQVIKRWLDLTNNDLALAEKFFVIDRVNEKNLPINIGLQEIYEYSQEVTQVTGKKIGAIILDHFHIISTHIDARKSPNFGIDSEQNTGRGDIRNLSLNGLATQLKALTQTLNTFCILLSQTTKGKGIGDTPLAKDAAYGVSQFEWIVDRIITIWQPLMRVQNKCATKFLAFQYAKIREKTIKDEIRELEPKVLVYSLQDGSIRVPCVNEYQNFEALLPEAEEARRALLKNEGIEYSIQIDLDSVKRALLN